MESVQTIYNKERYEIPVSEMKSWLAYIRDLSFFRLDAGNLDIAFHDKFHQYLKNNHQFPKGKDCVWCNGTGDSPYGGEGVHCFSCDGSGIKSEASEGKVVDDSGSLPSDEEIYQWALNKAKGFEREQLARQCFFEGAIWMKRFGR